MRIHDLYLTLRAIVIVLRDSNRTEEIHVVEEVTGRGRLAEQLRRMMLTPEGQQLLRDKPELCREQVDYDALRKLPPHTLGAAYVSHLDRNNITADLQARPTQHVHDPDVAYLMRRFRQTHDVWHALTGLGIAPHEEVTIHAFSWGQLRLPVSALVVLFGGIKHGLLERRWDMLLWSLREAYEAGRQAAPLLPVHWEKMWEEPLDEVRKRYGVRAVVA